MRVTKFKWIDFKAPDIICYNKWFGVINYFDPKKEDFFDRTKEWLIFVKDLSIIETLKWYSVRQNYKWEIRTITYNLKTEKDAILYKKWLENIMWLKDKDQLLSFEDRKILFQKEKEEIKRNIVFDFDEEETEIENENWSKKFKEIKNKKWFKDKIKTLKKTKFIGFDLKTPNIALFYYDEDWYTFLKEFNLEKIFYYKKLIKNWELIAGEFSIKKTLLWYFIKQKIFWKTRIVSFKTSLKKAERYKEWIGFFLVQLKDLSEDKNFNSFEERDKVTKEFPLKEDW